MLLESIKLQTANQRTKAQLNIYTTGDGDEKPKFVFKHSKLSCLIRNHKGGAIMYLSFDDNSLSLQVSKIESKLFFNSDVFSAFERMIDLHPRRAKSLATLHETIKLNSSLIIESLNIK